MHDFILAAGIDQKQGTQELLKSVYRQLDTRQPETRRLKKQKITWKIPENKNK